jgi:hypothetical protein
MRCSLSAVLIGLATATVLAQNPGPQPLTAETLKRAIEDGAAGEEPMYSPVMMRVKSRRDKELKKEIPHEVDADARLVHAMDKPPFMILIDTPYSMVVSVSAEAKRRFAEMPSVDLADLNAGVTIEIAPGPSLREADAVEDVILKKNDQVIRSIKATVKPTTIQNAMGASREVSDGQFVFPFEAFRADGPLTIIVIGQGGNWEWTMTRGELAQIR